MKKNIEDLKTDWDRFREALADLIEEAKITQSVLSRRTEQNGRRISQPKLSNIINGFGPKPSYEDVRVLAKSLKVPIKDLLGVKP